MVVVIRVVGWWLYQEGGGGGGGGGLILVKEMEGERGKKSPCIPLPPHSPLFPITTTLLLPLKKKIGLKHDFPNKSINFCKVGEERGEGMKVRVGRRGSGTEMDKRKEDYPTNNVGITRGAQSVTGLVTS